MYKCMDCSCNFEQPKDKRICFEYEYGVANLFDSRNYTNISVCPACESANIEEMQQCFRCGRLVSSLQNDLCDECYGEMYD